jgi:hypothetical protein
MNKNKLPAILLYTKYLNIASMRFNMSLNECRDKFGLFTLNQWHNLFCNPLNKLKMTSVKFLMEKKEGNLPCNVFAFFPNEPYYHTDKNMFTCYSHLGQHSSCHIDYANECKEANYNVYSDLLSELIAQGYKDLKIINSQVFECHRRPTAYEIQFGEGATHYRNFTLAQIGIKKDGDIKPWFKAKDDNLRYYR